MQEEQRSLSSIHTISVCSLLTDRSVRWQVITIAVVNIGMQLSGIDAVSVQGIVVLYVFVSMCAHISDVQRLCSYYESESSYCYISRLCSTHLPHLLSIHHSPTCSHWVTKQGGNGTMPHYLLVLSVSVTQHETVHLSTHRTHLCSSFAPCGWKLYACWFTC